MIFIKYILCWGRAYKEQVFKYINQRPWFIFTVWLTTPEITFFVTFLVLVFIWSYGWVIGKLGAKFLNCAYNGHSGHHTISHSKLHTRTQAIIYNIFCCTHWLNIPSTLRNLISQLRKSLSFAFNVLKPFPDPLLPQLGYTHRIIYFCVMLLWHKANLYEIWFSVSHLVSSVYKMYFGCSINSQTNILIKQTGIQNTYN